MKNIVNKTVLITGGLSGIGLEMATKFIEEGASVIVFDYNDAAAAEVKAKLGDKFSSFKVDVSNIESVKSAVSQIGNIDILINNAGIVSGKPIDELEYSEIERTLQVNVMSLFIMVKELLPKFNENSYIVNTASAAGFFGLAKQSDYAASKFAVVGFSESIRNEFKKYNRKIRVLTVCPYYIDTGMFEGVKTKIPFLMPILKPTYVAKKIVKAVKRNRQLLIMPRFVYIAPLVKIFPTPISLAILNFFGMNSGMDEFVGRKTK
jgi:all-trans-retinol dehydrogenase (NAD+)